MVVTTQTNRNLVNMGQWALTCKLQDQDATSSPRVIAGESTMEASAPVDAGWDGPSGSLPARQEPPEAPPKRAMRDDMELAQDQCRWIPSEVLLETTCQQKPLGLSLRCNEKKTCLRCASQHQIEGGYENLVEYLSAADFPSNHQTQGAARKPRTREGNPGTGKTKA